MYREGDNLSWVVENAVSPASGLCKQPKNSARCALAGIQPPEGTSSSLPPACIPLCASFVVPQCTTNPARWHQAPRTPIKHLQRGAQGCGSSAECRASSPGGLIASPFLQTACPRAVLAPQDGCRWGICESRREDAEFSGLWRGFGWPWPCYQPAPLPAVCAGAVKVCSHALG